MNGFTGGNAHAHGGFATDATVGGELAEGVPDAAVGVAAAGGAEGDLPDKTDKVGIPIERNGDGMNLVGGDEDVLGAPVKPGIFQTEEGRSKGVPGAPEAAKDVGGQGQGQVARPLFEGGGGEEVEGEGGCRQAFVGELVEGGCRQALDFAHGEGLVTAQAKLLLALLRQAPGVMENAGSFVIQSGVAQTLQMARFGVVGGHRKRFGGGVVVQPFGGSGVGLLQDMEQQAVQAAGGDVLPVNRGAVGAEGDGKLLHGFPTGQVGSLLIPPASTDLILRLLYKHHAQTTDAR